MTLLHIKQVINQAGYSLKFEVFHVLAVESTV